YRLLPALGAAWSEGAGLRLLAVQSGSPYGAAWELNGDSNRAGQATDPPLAVKLSGERACILRPRARTSNRPLPPCLPARHVARSGIVRAIGRASGAGRPCGWHASAPVWRYQRMSAKRSRALRAGVERLERRETPSTHALAAAAAAKTVTINGTGTAHVIQSHPVVNGRELTSAASGTASVIGKYTATFET